MKPWTAAEDAILTELYRQLSAGEMAARMDRSRASIKNRVHQLGLRKRWRFVHVMLWEEANGPVPAGHTIAFRNGDKTDIRLENLECISRRELMRRNTVHNYPPELVQVMRLKGAITKRIATRQKKEQAA